MSSFSNEQLNSIDLPRVEDICFVPIEKDYLKILLLYISLSNIILTVILSAYFIFKPFALPSTALYSILTIASIRIAWSYYSTVKSFPHKAFALREKDIIYKSGWLWRHMVTAPFNRVQHIQIDQGILERQFNLSKLKIFTAGGSSSDITIPGLRPEQSARLKQFIVAKTALDEEE